MENSEVPRLHGKAQGAGGALSKGSALPQRTAICNIAAKHHLTSQ